MKNYISYNLSRKIWYENKYKRKIKTIAVLYSFYGTEWRGYCFQEKGGKTWIQKCSAVGKHTGKFFRKVSNKKIRHKDNDFITHLNYNKYRKIFDYWWTID